MLLNFGRAGWVDKARQQPEKVKQVLQKIRTDGLVATAQSVQAKLDQPIALGYSQTGVVIEADEASVDGFKIGDRVVSNGPHAEITTVPRNLCARLPDSVSFDEAAFTVLGAIGLQGVRLIQPTLGEAVVVTGLGLIGLLCVQILRAHGCRVLGIDFDPARCSLARQFGAETVDLSRGEDPVAAALAFSRGRGVDAVLIAASTQSNEPVSQAARMCRKRGRIVLVGVVGLELTRADFYEKELTFQVSCSYGPGRYDERYEQKGQDYPLGFVRWTEQRNFEAFLDLLAERRVDVQPLISHRFSFENALAAYDLVGQGKGLGILLDYGTSSPAELNRVLRLRESVSRISNAAQARQTVVGMIGAGNFTRQVLLPLLKTTGARLKTIASASGVTGTYFGRKFGFEVSTTDLEAIFADPEVNTLIVSTRHDSHARLVLRALDTGRNVYVEKPLCLTREELAEIARSYGQGPVKSGPGVGQSSQTLARPSPLLMVGFNRRFAPHVVRMRRLLERQTAVKAFVFTANAGQIPAKHWTQDPEAGGGRIIGEACHFIDLLRFLAGTPITAASAQLAEGATAENRDIAAISLQFEDGSIGTIHYLSNGSKRFPKERLEVFCGGGILQLDNFRILRGYDWPGFKRLTLWRQDKGHAGEIQAWFQALALGGPSPISSAEIFEVSQVAIDLASCGRYLRA